MENQSNSRTTKSDIGGTVYVVESRVSDSAKGKCIFQAETTDYSQRKKPFKVIR
ncbi:MAG: hypothetical protein ACOX3L_03810 [Lutisporaceae bacterium]